MFGLPQSAQYNKIIPKQKFYDKLPVNSALKRLFIDQIIDISWKYKLAPDTVNLAKGEDVAEIEVFHIRLKTGVLDEKLLLLMDREIPYHLLFILEYDGKYRLCIGYKEAKKTDANKFKVTAYYTTEFMAQDGFRLVIDGLSMDAVYDNFVRQIGAEALNTDKSEAVKDAVARAKRKEVLLKKRAALETKIRNEKQFKVQIKLNEELTELNRQIKELD